jgi:hypothetical protein
MVGVAVGEQGHLEFGRVQAVIFYFLFQERPIKTRAGIDDDFFNAAENYGIAGKFPDLTEGAETIEVNIGSY